MNTLIEADDSEVSEVLAKQFQLFIDDRLSPDGIRLWGGKPPSAAEWAQLVLDTLRERNYVVAFEDEEEAATLRTQEMGGILKRDGVSEVAVCWPKAKAWFSPEEFSEWFLTRQQRE